MSVYRNELQAAELLGSRAHEAMEAWVSRAADAPDDTPASVLEGYARDLRESRERLHKLVGEHGTRDDIAAALTKNEEYHRSLGLSIRDIPDVEPDPE